MSLEIDFESKYNITFPKEISPNDEILVIEDQQDLRMIIVHQLHKLTYQKTIQAQNGYDALEIIKNNPKISAIFCDEAMPVMGGIDLLEELQNSHEIQRPPFCLAMTGVSKEKVMFALEKGVDEILAKPYTLNDIGPRLFSTFKKFHNPRNPERIYELAKTLMINNRPADAMEVYQSLAQASPGSARPWVSMARIAAKRNDLPAAFEFLQKGEERNAFFVHTFSMRGDLYIKQKSYEKALVCYTRAIELSPLNPIRYKSAANVLFKLNRFQDAIQILEKAQASEVIFPELFHLLSQGYWALKDFAKATKSIRAALASEPDNVVFLNQLGICLKETKQFDEAEKVYNQIIKKNPDNLPALYNKAVLMMAKGDKEESKKLFQRVLKKDPNFTQAQNKLAELEKAG